MNKSVINKKKWLHIVIIAAFSIVIGTGFSCSLGNIEIMTIVGSILVSVFIAVTISSFEQFLTEKILKKFNFLSALLIRMLVYILVILSALSFGFSVFFWEASDGYFALSKMITQPEFHYSVIYSIIISFAIVFIMTVSTYLGQGTLIGFLSGRYHRPREEEKIFMFLDIQNSTAIAEKIGHRSFLSLLDDFFFDITPAVIFTKGKIYKYVGDEAIITWDMAKGLNKADCIKCFFLIKEIIKSNKNKYKERYGLIPNFKAGIHGGIVVVGEMGYFRKEIAYIGDVLNTTARIEGQCSASNRKLLISEELIERFSDIETYILENMGTFYLRGKKKEMKLFSVDYS